MALAAKIAVSDDPAHDSDHAKLLEIVRTRSFKTGNFVLSSGKPSNLYFNMKPTMMHPRGAELAAREFLAIAESVEAEWVGGLEMCAVPVIGSMAALSSLGDRPVCTFFVRKKAKGHGTMEVIEGLSEDESLSGKKVLVVDDVATSGQSMLIAIEAARKAGAIVDHAACLVNREEGADAFLKEHRITLHSVFHAHDFVAAS